MELNRILYPFISVSNIQFVFSTFGTNRPTESDNYSCYFYILSVFEEYVVIQVKGYNSYSNFVDRKGVILQNDNGKPHFEKNTLDKIGMTFAFVTFLD